MNNFRSLTNFEELTPILNPINEENKTTFKNELKKYLNEHPYQKYKEENVKIYYEFEEMKNVVQSLNNYSFVNKDILCKAMGISEDYLKGKMVRVSKNKNNTCFIFNNFTLTIPKKKVEEIKKYKNLYYVEDITKKIFTLLYSFNEKVLKKKMENEIKETNDFKAYYLINNLWLDEYKSFFLYDLIKSKLEKKFKNSNDNYTYKKVKYNLDEIVKDLGQIRLGESQLNDLIRNAEYLIPENKMREINWVTEPELESLEIQEYFTPYGFSIINKDILDLIQKEQFFNNMDDSLEDIIKYEILIGNGQIIIKNKKIENKDQIVNENSSFSKDYLFYVDRKNVKIVENDSEKDQNYILYYLLNYEKKKETLFYNDLITLNKKNGFEEFTKKLDLKDIGHAQPIQDTRGNISCNFIFFRNIEEIIKNNNIENINNDNLKISNVKIDDINNKNNNSNIVNSSTNNDLNIDNNDNNTIKNTDNNINSNNTLTATPKLGDEKKDNNCINMTPSESNISNKKNLSLENQINFSIENNNKNSNNNNSNISELRIEKIESISLKSFDIISKLIIEKIDRISLNSFDNISKLRIDSIDRISLKSFDNILIVVNNCNISFESSKKITPNENSINDSKEIISLEQNNKDEINIDEKLMINEKDLGKKVEELDNFFNNEEIKNDFLNSFQYDINYLDINVNEKNKEKINQYLLIREENFYKYISFINYYAIKNFLLKEGLKKEEKNDYLQVYIKDFYKLYLLYKNEIDVPNNISLISNYSDYLQNKDKGDRLQYILLNKTKLNEKLINKKEKYEDIYLVEYPKSFYIYFSECKELLKIQQSFGRLKLNECQGEKEIVEIINNYSDKNKEFKDLKNLINKEKKEFYLFNKKLIEELKDKKENIINGNNIPFQKEKISSTNYECPQDFLFIIKEKETEILINILNEKYNYKEIYQKTLFFLDDGIIKSDKFYLGMFETNNIIFFYLYIDGEYIFQFLLDFDNEDIMKSEFNNIIKKGIIEYLYEIGIDSKNGKQFLINLEMECQGAFYIDNDIELNYNYNEYPRHLEANDDINFDVVIQCLVNIGPLMDIFLNRNKLFEIGIKPQKRITFKFFKIMQYMWNINLDLGEEVPIINFMIELNELFQDTNITGSMELLIESILLSMYYEYDLNYIEKNNYNIKDMKESLSDYDHNSFIKDIFFFNLLSDSKCKCDKKISSTKVLISFSESKEKIEALESKEKTMENLINEFKIDLFCNTCKETIQSKIQFESFPKILIIAVDKQKFNIKFKYEEQITIKDINQKEGKYELISVIQNFLKEGIMSFLKSTKEKKWYHNKKEKSETLTSNYLKNYVKDLPNLLIYQKIDINDELNK